MMNISTTRNIITTKLYTHTHDDFIESVSVYLFVRTNVCKGIHLKVVNRKSTLSGTKIYTKTRKPTQMHTVHMWWARERKKERKTNTHPYVAIKIDIIVLNHFYFLSCVLEILFRKFDTICVYVCICVKLSMYTIIHELVWYVCCCASVNICLRCGKICVSHIDLPESICKCERWKFNNGSKAARNFYLA